MNTVRVMSGPETADEFSRTLCLAKWPRQRRSMRRMHNGATLFHKLLSFNVYL